MLQTIEGKQVYVVVFEEIPELPITWEKPEERLYAEALARAIHSGYITEGGKYGIEIVPGGAEEHRFWVKFDSDSNTKYVVYKIIEPVVHARDCGPNGG